MKTALRKKIYKFTNSDAFCAMVFLAPIVLGLILFQMVPIIMSVVLSFTKYDLFNAPKFIGLLNYENLFNLEISSVFWGSIKNIVIFTVLFVTSNILLGLTLAVLLKNLGKLGNAFRVVYFLPLVCSVVATSVIWKWLYNDVYGPLTRLLEFFGVEGYGFFTPTHRMLSLIVMAVWGGFGTPMLLYTAALRNIPGHLYEAAAMDGAGGFKSFMKITVPMVSPTTFYLLLTEIIGSLQAYSIFLTVGLDKFSPVLVVFGYAGHGIGNLSTYGYACAMGLFYGLLVLIIAVINFRTSKKWVNYDV